MQKHEYYEELCALLPIGQLSVGEWQELAEHLKGCTSCRNTTDEFSIILEKMPLGEMDVDERALAVLQDDSYRTHFLQRAFAEGVPFSAAVLQARSRTQRWWWPRFRLMPSFAVAAFALIAGLSTLFFVRRGGFEPRLQPLAQTVALALPPAPGNKPAIAELENKINALENQSAHDRLVISQLTEKLGQSRADSYAAIERLATTAGQLGEVQKQAGEAQRRLDTAREDLRRLKSEKESVDAALVEQQFKITELTAHIKENDVLAERERELNAVTRDVRNLMGARNLHILDVSDVDGSGRSSKTFGRVFFVEEKSLIFYAFDLGDRGNPSKVSFQAWAQVEGRQQNKAKNLGVFYVDDRAQKRWVLKVNDPEKLRAVNSVFVTIEPLGGASRPTGKKLLYAYVGSQANHP